MRVTDDRYTRDRQRLDLAIRMIHHEARTQTIRTWTGLTDDRIRKLYRAYVQAQSKVPGATVVRRHRGKSPRQAAFFLRNLETRREAAALAGLFALLGLLHQAARDVRAGTQAALRWGDLFCRVYETYRALHRSHRISFEHACHLLHALERRAELAIDACPSCDALMVVDMLRTRTPVCAWCEAEQRARQAQSLRARALPGVAGAAALAAEGDERDDVLDPREAVAVHAAEGADEWEPA
jgi:hypothetical protein